MRLVVQKLHVVLKLTRAVLDWSLVTLVDSERLSCTTSGVAFI